jgi:5'-nucleotidase
MKIVHFNDVYNIDVRNEADGIGAALFVGMMKALNPDGSALVLFSGDCFSPAELASIFKGRHMRDVLNAFPIHVACIGNHDFDHGLDKLRVLIG